jgi:gamma-glutamyltranspeptidase/glutathione hydrolase
VLTNPPPSSGGILIAYSLDLLERLARPGDLRALVEVMDTTNRARTEEFVSGLHHEGYLERFMAKEALESAAHDVGSRLGSTTHVAVLDGEGGCASVTCSNGSCSGVIVPGTGLHLNNMLGEEDLNPLGFHRHEPGLRIPSMMAPTVVLREGSPEVALGSAGSNRIRSAILQTILAIVDSGLSAAEAVERPRVHFEGGAVEAEPGVDEEALAALERDGWTVKRWSERNLYFGGAQAVARDPSTGSLSGGGDPRRGGAAIVVASRPAAARPREASGRGRPFVAVPARGVGGCPASDAERARNASRPGDSPRLCRDRNVRSLWPRARQLSPWPAGYSTVHGTR